MKNKKIMKATPVIETKQADYIPGTVGEFINVLQNFPPDKEFTLNGSVSIKGFEIDGDPNCSISIYPEGVINKDEHPHIDCVECDCLECDCENQYSDELIEYADKMMDNHYFGIATKNNEYLEYLRGASIDGLSFTTPNIEQLDFEEKNLTHNQQLLIDEIRANNMCVAEYLGELHRREIAALLEYNTQCLTHFGCVTNREMCRIAAAGDESVIKALLDSDDVEITNF